MSRLGARHVALASGALAAITAAAWLASARWTLGGYSSSGHGVIFTEGCLRLVVIGDEPIAPACVGWRIYGPGCENPAGPHEFKWWPDGWGSPTAASGGGIDIPLWMPAVVLALTSAASGYLTLRPTLRRRRGACAGCGYGLAGLEPATPCPECGAAR